MALSRDGGILLSCFGKKVSKEAALGEVLS